MPIPEANTSVAVSGQAELARLEIFTDCELPSKSSPLLSTRVTLQVMFLSMSASIGVYVSLSLASAKPSQKYMILLAVVSSTGWTHLRFQYQLERHVVRVKMNPGF